MITTPWYILVYPGPICKARDGSWVACVVFPRSFETEYAIVMFERLKREA